MRLKNQLFFSHLNRLVFPWFYLGHPRTGVTQVRADARTQFNVRVNTSDRLVIWEIWKLGAYDDARFPIRPEDVVVDVGAHIGVFAVRAAQRAARGRVIACEAAGENYRLLAQNAQLNGLDHLLTEHTAVWEREGEVDLYTPNANGALGSVLQDHSGQRERVAATTLDELADRHGLARINHLKIDAEGAEYPILFATSAATLRKISFMVLEYHEFPGLAWGPRDLEQFLTGHGFRVEFSGGVWPQRTLYGTACLKAWK